jgi:hypothetical protein
MADIFISYSKAHREDTEQLAQYLEAKGYTVWWDTSLVAGDRFADTILSELASARAAIVIWSPASVRSDWVRSEATRANARSILIPVRTSDLQIAAIPPPFDVFHTEVVTNYRSIEAALLRLGVRPGVAVTATDRSGTNRTPQVEPNNRTVGVQAANSGHLVILVHGINTRALWMDEVKPTLESEGFSVAATSFGVYGVVRFLAPFAWFRKKAIERVVRDIRMALLVYRKEFGKDPTRLSVISHSFGTYVLSRIMAEHSEFKWYRVIFCGSVVREDYSFESALDRFDPPLLNEIGTRDFWPALAESAGWGYGSVGSSGFNRPPVVTRWHHEFRHSDFLTASFSRTFWVPFLKGLDARPADKAEGLPLWIRLLTVLPLRWFAVLIVLATIMISIPTAAQLVERYQAAILRFLGETPKNSTEDLTKRLVEKRESFLRVDQAIQASYKDVVDAGNAGVVKLLADPSQLETLGLRGGGSYYSFRRRTHEYGYGSNIKLEHGTLKVGFAGLDFGYLLDLGNRQLRLVIDTTSGEQPPWLEANKRDAWSFLWTYSPPGIENEVRLAQSEASRGRTVGGATIGDSAPIIVGHSYLLRSIEYDRSDTLTAIFVHSILPNGDGVFVWKILKVFDRPSSH